ncbi:DUF86 domain-containing protein [Longirhabdus pacifica]|uniref:DUF86 domain-containing protein n=1 Tax=Longirhabdus pacifica TaxID=2305227 RepID=UPI00100928A2|nr:HepT-like ribonuclease domain-containing protein [Longirhabdus pacifica]
MYYINDKEIEKRLQFIPTLITAMEELQSEPEAGLVHYFAQDRTLHLAIEVITDVGSYIIDGYLMREASSYEDIITVIAGENVLSQQIVDPIIKLVQERRNLVQDYYELPQHTLSIDNDQLKALCLILQTFKQDVELYLEQNT